MRHQSLPYAQLGRNPDTSSDDDFDEEEEEDDDDLPPQQEDTPGELEDLPPWRRDELSDDPIEDEGPKRRVASSGSTPKTGSSTAPASSAPASGVKRAAKNAPGGLLWKNPAANAKAKVKLKPIRKVIDTDLRYRFVTPEEAATCARRGTRPSWPEKWNAVEDPEVPAYHLWHQRS